MSGKEGVPKNSEFVKEVRNGPTGSIRHVDKEKKGPV
jgi:hypothetical protein